MILVFGDAAASLCPTPPPMNEESCETEGVSVAFFVKGIILIRSFIFQTSKQTKVVFIA